MAIVEQAPETAAKVEAGEIRSTDKAVRDAKAEITGKPAPPKVGGAVTTEKSANEYIGQALYNMRMAAQVKNPGRQAPAELDAKLAEVIKLAEGLRGGTP